MGFANTPTYNRPMLRFVLFGGYPLIGCAVARLILKTDWCVVTIILFTPYTAFLNLVNAEINAALALSGGGAVGICHVTRQAGAYLPWYLC
jgi:predicted acylesterase/phospholipase RssA